MTPIEKAKLRVAKLIYETDECIESKPLNADGYVEFQYWGNKKKIHLRIHRISYMMANNLEKIDDGKIVCHKCDNPKCINPRHLFLGTHENNVADKLEALRSALAFRQSL